MAPEFRERKRIVIDDAAILQFIRANREDFYFDGKVSMIQ